MKAFFLGAINLEDGQELDKDHPLLKDPFNPLIFHEEDIAKSNWSGGYSIVIPKFRKRSEKRVLLDPPHLSAKVCCYILLCH